jgi:hypothetical protein
MRQAMTSKQSSARLCLYASIAFITPVASNWSAMETATLFQWGGMLMQSMVTSLIAIRAYIDQSPNQVEK